MPLTAPLTALIDDVLGQVPQALNVQTTGPWAFILMLHLLRIHISRADAGVAYT